MFAGHQSATRGGADIMPRIMCSELHPLIGKPINIGRSKFLLTVATQITITKIIGQDKNDIGLVSSNDIDAKTQPEDCYQVSSATAEFEGYFHKRHKYWFILFCF
jgi:hypothetical protein